MKNIINGKYLAIIAVVVITLSLILGMAAMPAVAGSSNDEGVEYAGAEIPDYSEIDATGFDYAVGDYENAGYGTDDFEDTFDYIQDAIDEAGTAENHGGIIVFSGEYEEDVNISSDYDGLELVSYEGPEETTIDTQGTDVGVEIWASDVTFEGFEVIGFDQIGIQAGDPWEEDDFVLSDVTIRYNIVPEGETDEERDATRALYLAAVDGGVVENNELGAQPGDTFGSDLGYFTFEVGKSRNIDVTNNNIFAEEIDTHGGIMISGETFESLIGDHEIIGNTIENYSEGRGIRLTASFGPIVDVKIEKNQIQSNERGISLENPDGDITNINVYYNNIENNEDYGVWAEEDVSVDATYNWWGTEDPEEIEASTEGDVDYEPWLDEDGEPVVDEDEITGLTVIEDPDEMEYIEGQALDLAGLVVEVEWEIAENEELTWPDNEGVLEAEPSDGTELTVEVHDNETITVWHEGFDKVTDTTDETLTVEKAEVGVEIHPETLNLGSQGRWITAYIELNEDHVVENIEVDNVELIHNDNELKAEWGELQDDILMVKFDRGEVTKLLGDIDDEEITLTITGEVDEMVFEGTDEIRVIEPGEGRGRESEPGPDENPGRGPDENPGRGPDENPGRGPGQ